MAKERRIFKIYKRGQGAWARILLASVLGLFLLWMLNSIDGSISATWKLLEEKEIALDSKDGKLELAVGDVEGLPANAGKLDVEVIPSGSSKGERSRLTREEVKEQIAAGKKVILKSNLVVSHLLTPEDLRRIREYKSAEETIPVRDPERAAGTEYFQLGRLEAEVETGKALELAGNVLVPTWWHLNLVTVPAIEVDLTYGNLVVVVAFLLAAFGIYKLVNRPRSSDFLIETESELKRVDWPTRLEVFASTKVVVTMVIIFLVMMFTYDFIYGQLIGLVKQIFF